jgi:hypothetical protein
MFMKQLPEAIGVIWYKNEKDFLAARAIFADAFLLPDTYREYLEAFSEISAKIKAAGKTIVKAELDPGTFVSWCNARGLNVDADGRTAFANEKAIEFLKQSGKL